MKKFFAITAGVCMLAMPAIAATRCIKDIQTGNCTYAAQTNSVWVITCSSDNIRLYGEAMCGATAYDWKDSVPAGSAVCWCRLLYPYVSKWVFPGGTYGCTNCASVCAQDVRDSISLGAFAQNRAF